MISPNLHHSVDLSLRTQNNFIPAWSEKVDRWYQLDELGFAFAESLHHWNYLDGFSKPDILFLCIEGGSNIADKDFVSSGSQSPAKFVYTLPNISAAVIFQILQFKGKVYCPVAGENTLNQSLTQAQVLAKNGKKVWILGTPLKNPLLKEKNLRTVLFYNF